MKRLQETRGSHDKGNMFKLWRICKNERGTAGCVTLGRTMCDCTVDLRARGTWPSLTAHCWVCFTAEREAAGRVSQACCSPALEVHFSDLIMIDCWYDFMTHYWPAAHLLLLSIIWLRSLLAAETEWCSFSLCSQTGWFYRLNVLGMSRTVREVNKNRSQVFRELCCCSAGFPSGCDLLSNAACCCYGNFSPSKYGIKIFCCLMLCLFVTLSGDLVCNLQMERTCRTFWVLFCTFVASFSVRTIALKHHNQNKGFDPNSFLRVNYYWPFQTHVYTNLQIGW